MNTLTLNFLTSVWSKVSDSSQIQKSVIKCAQKLHPAHAAIIVKDLEIRRSKLFTKEFHEAACLASDGMAGNDGFLDLTDCLSFLPEDRFQRVLENHDNLIDEPLSLEFGEYHLHNELRSVFDNFFGDDGEYEGLLMYLTDDGVDSWEDITSERIIDHAKLFPRLLQKYGKLLEEPSEEAIDRTVDCETIGLGDLIPHDIKDNL